MSRKHVLIVENEDSLLNLQSLLLRARGYDVQGASNGAAAMDCVACHKPDIVLLDVMLPDADGFELCRQIKNEEATRHIPVVIVSSRQGREDFARGEQVGADGYITKPFRSAMLVETVQRLVSGH